jgi:hypothetical protein
MRKGFLISAAVVGLAQLSGNHLAMADNSPIAQPETVYIYTGNPFNRFQGTYACPPDCGGLRGAITIVGRPPVDLVGSGLRFDFDISPIDYNFTDGFTTWTKQNSCFDRLSVSTNEAGNIVSWVIRAFEPSATAPCNSPAGTTFSGFQLLTTSGGAEDIIIEAPAQNYVASLDQPGTWRTHVLGVAPEPSYVLILIASLAYLVHLKAKRSIRKIGPDDTADGPADVTLHNAPL